MKRKRKSHSADGSAKRQRCDGNRQPPIVPLLEQYHHEVHSLRTYLVSRLPKSAKKRRRRLLHYGVQPLQDETVLVNDRTAQLLDTTLVGTSKHISTKELEQFDQDISLFTQQVTESDISLTPSAGHLKQSEVGPERSHLLPPFAFIIYRRSNPTTELTIYRLLTLLFGLCSADILDRIALRTSYAMDTSDLQPLRMERKLELYLEFQECL